MIVRLAPRRRVVGIAPDKHRSGGGVLDGGPRGIPPRLRGDDVIRQAVRQGPALPRPWPSTPPYRGAPVNADELLRNERGRLRRRPFEDTVLIVPREIVVRLGGREIVDG